jgi:hypothetical protein
MSDLAALQPRIDAFLKKEADAGFMPCKVTPPLAGKMRGCFICWSTKPPFRVGALGKRDEKAKLYVWMLAVTCQKCGDDPVKIARLVDGLMKLPRGPR